MLAFVLFGAATAAALVEASARSYPSRAEWRTEARISIILGAGALLIETMLPDRGAPAPVSHGLAVVVAVFLADDFLYYLSHRLAHRVSLFWASHAVHHSPRRYDFLTGLRQPPTWLITPAAAAPLILMWCGAPPALVALCASVRGVHHFLIHTERVRRLPSWIEFLFNTPSHHRVHHGVEEACIDRNFGGVMIIWDRMFATFALEPDDGVKHYGLAQPARLSAWATVVDPWSALIKRVRATATLRAKLALAFAPPTAVSSPSVRHSSA